MYFSRLPSSAKVEFADAATKSACSEFFQDPKQLLDGAGIKPFKIKERDGTSVHRLTLPCGNFFLKRYPAPNWRKVIKCFVLGRQPATMASHEYRAAKLLQSKDIPILNAVAWGERRVLGIWPTANFILSEEVKGDRGYWHGSSTKRCVDAP